MSRRPCTRWQRGRANLSASLSSASSTTPGSASPSTWTTSMSSQMQEVRELERGWWRYVDLEILLKSRVDLNYGLVKLNFDAGGDAGGAQDELRKMHLACQWHLYFQFWFHDLHSNLWFTHRSSTGTILALSFTKEEVQTSTTQFHSRWGAEMYIFFISWWSFIQRRCIRPHQWRGQAHLPGVEDSHNEYKLNMTITGNEWWKKKMTVVMKWKLKETPFSDEHRGDAQICWHDIRPNVIRSSVLYFFWS